MAMLEPTELKLYESGSDNPAGAARGFAQGEGYLQVVDNSALLIVEDAIKPEDLDPSSLEARKSEAEKTSTRPTRARGAPPRRARDRPRRGVPGDRQLLRPGERTRYEPGTFS